MMYVDIIWDKHWIRDLNQYVLNIYPSFAVRRLIMSLLFEMAGPGHLFGLMAPERLLEHTLMVR